MREHSLFAVIVNKSCLFYMCSTCSIERVEVREDTCFSYSPPTHVGDGAVRDTSILRAIPEGYGRHAEPEGY